MLERQLEIAIQTDFPILIHTPKNQKKEALERILAIVNSTKINPQKVLLDHIDTTTIDKLANTEFHIGLSIQPSKLSIHDAGEIIRKYKDIKIVLNSDLGSYASDPLALPKTALFLKKRGISEERIYEICYENALTFYSLYDG